MRFEGIIPAMLTPYGKDDEVNYDAVGEMASRLVEQGIGGLFVCGSTGEWFVLDQKERMGILDKVMDTVGGRTKVMAHVGAASRRWCVELARHAERAGADAISVLPPIGRPYGSEEIWDHFRAIGESADLPLYLYHLPQVYGDIITIDKFVEAIDTIPTLAGAKFSSYRVDDLIDLRLKAGGRLNILSGCGEQLMSAIACGADGSICTWYNYIPRLGNKIIECVKAGDIEAAREHEDLLVKFAMLCIKKAYGYMKFLVGLRGIECGRPRLPIPGVTRGEAEALLPKIEATGILEWCI